ncbi:MAG TPA: hypothetical protein VHV47_09820 [Opitutaceae bacterium]|jgi:hypothetical protein|nr:hypothetical protein [Opitutaceae bacterium]
MARTIKPAKPSKAFASGPSEQFVRVRIKALEIPPVKDGIVIGKAAPIGVESMLRTLKLMSAERFARIQFPDDNVISDAIVRESVIRKLGEARLREFIGRRVKPLMAENELLLLDMEIEVVVEDTL